MTTLLEVQNVSKSYGTTRVLEDITLSIAPGESVSIIGENGAGKSTLAKIIAGITPPSHGRVRWQERPVSFATPKEAIEAGIGIVHQEISLIESLTIAENISLGREPTWRGFLQHGVMNSVAQRALERLHSDLTPSRKVATLSTAQKQIVEIARALSYDAKLMIFDEPTSSLGEQEGALILDIIRRLKASGVAIMYVSHRLPEVQEISDRVVALRDGKNSGELPASQLTRERLIHLIVGREIKDVYGYSPRPVRNEVLALQDFQATARHAPCNLALRAGEIVGIAGLIGSGRTELLEAIYGITPRTRGEMSVKGVTSQISCPQDARMARVSLLPEDRKAQGIVASFSIKDNITVGNIARGANQIFRHFAKERAVAQGYILSLGVRCASPEQPIVELSGGNQQKVVLAKCLATNPAVLLLDEPTRGVDVGARREIYALLFDLARQGTAILFVSSELEEVLGIADRVLVMSDGAITGTLDRKDFSEHAVMSLAAHSSRKAA